MDIVAFLAAILEILGNVPPRRITLKERYETKKKRRELQRREKRRSETNRTRN